MLGRGREYMDLETESSESGLSPESGLSTSSGRAPGARPPGPTARTRPSGLAARAGGAFHDGVATPMMPGTWEADPDRA